MIVSKKFDVVVGNPPYQDEAVGEATSAPPIYPKFMDAAYEVANKAVLITPARFLFNAGYTSKKWNERMLNDPHLSAPVYVANSDDLFPGTGIRGGVVVTYRDGDRRLGPIGTFLQHRELSDILKKVEDAGAESLAEIVTKRDAYRYTDNMHEEHPQASSLMSRSSQKIVNANAFDQLPFLFYSTKPADGREYASIMGVRRNRRETMWIRSDYITGPESFHSYKVSVPKANGSGRFGETLSTPIVLRPLQAVTQTFLTVGNFESPASAEACMKYIKTKFARAMLGILKITQDNPARVWKNVPMQDFSSSSDIDWTKSIDLIDLQLYQKYGLTSEEVGFIESHVKAMD